MGSYRPGDVILVSVSIDDGSMTKVRPAVVVAEDGGKITICPVSSRAPSDAASVPITLEDFARGGLDLFGESFVLTARRLTIRSGDVIGKRGHLWPESLAGITAGIFPAGSRGKSGTPGRSSRKSR